MSIEEYIESKIHLQVIMGKGTIFKKRNKNDKSIRHLHKFFTSSYALHIDQNPQDKLF
jgi:hypothetical protein